MASAYTVLCHAEIETYLEASATKLLDFAANEWASRRPTRQLVHICTFHEGRGNTNSVPNNDIWNEVVTRSILKQKGIIKNNKGIKEANVCEMFTPLGFDTRSIDPILLSDLTAFGVLRGDHAHKAQNDIIGTSFDPFDIVSKVEGIVQLLSDFDEQIAAEIVA